MIAPMQKVSVLCARDERDAVLQLLYELGVVHLQHGAQAEDQDLEARRRELQRLGDAHAVLVAAAAGDGDAGRSAPATATTLDARAVADAVLALATERTECQRAITGLELEREAVLPFGDFEPAAFERLRAAGVAVALLRYPVAAPPALPAGTSLHVLSTIDGMVAAAVVGTAGQDLGVRPLPVPDRGLAEVERELAQRRRRVVEIETELATRARDAGPLRAAAAAVKERVELLTARAGMGQDGAVAWITGFCPEDREVELRALATQHAMVVVVRAVTPDDVVPTLLAGPRWVRQVHSVFEGIGIVPGYAEADVSALFLLFLMLFAAMLIGDAGYGALLLGLALWFGRRFKSSPGGPPQALRLLRSTAVATIAWGALTGTWFAIPNLPSVLDAVRIEWLAGADKLATSRHIMLFCFLLGALHLTVAHLWAAWRCGKSLQALAQFGWIACTWLMFALARTMVLGEPFPTFMGTVAVVGVALIVLFMTPPKQLKHEWFNHVMLPLNLVSNFVDVVSYLRLFAVGSAGVAVASSFNDMAVKAAAGGGMGFVTAALIAVFGHSLNLLLCAMGVLVHGVRLNTLEFSAHLGLQWSGVPYRPFGRARSSADQAGGQP